MPVSEKSYYSLDEASLMLGFNNNDVFHLLLQRNISFFYLMGRDDEKSVYTLELHKNKQCAHSYYDGFSWMVFRDVLEILCKKSNTSWHTYEFSNELCSMSIEPIKTNANQRHVKMFSLHLVGLFEVKTSHRFPYDILNTKNDYWMHQLSLVIPYQGIENPLGNIFNLYSDKHFLPKKLIYIHNDSLRNLLINKKDNEKIQSKTTNKQAELIAQLIYLQFGEEALRNLAYHANPENKSPIISEKLTAAGFRPPAKGVILRWLQDANVNVNDIIAAAKEHLSHRK